LFYFKTKSDKYQLLSLQFPTVVSLIWAIITCKKIMSKKYIRFLCSLFFLFSFPPKKINK
jgi:hypothetical protein